MQIDVSEKQQARWDTFIENTEEHEQEHVDICQTGQGDIKKAIEGAGPGQGSGATCEEACDKAAQDLDSQVEAAGNQAVQKVEEKQEAYDNKTEHSETQGAVLDCT